MTYVTNLVGCRSWGISEINRTGLNWQLNPFIPGRVKDFVESLQTPVVLTPLTSYGSPDAVWTPGDNVAVCRGGLNLTPHESPDTDCHCGFYAFNNLRMAQTYILRRRSPTIVGAVAGAGRAEIHNDGWRAERAQIIAFYFPKLLFNKKDRREKKLKVAEILAENYGVPLFRSRRKFIAYTKSLGALSPEELKPESNRFKRWLTNPRTGVRFALLMLATVAAKIFITDPDIRIGLTAVYFLCMAVVLFNILSVARSR